MRRMFSESQIKELISASLIENSKCQVQGYFTDEGGVLYVILPNVVENQNEVKVNILDVSKPLTIEKIINFENQTISAINIGGCSVQLVRIADCEVLKVIDI